MKKLIIYLVANRIIVILIIFFISNLRPFSFFINTFGHRWDGNSYTFIADHGYVTQGEEKNFIVFPPFYPSFIKIVSLTGINPTLSGVIISNIFFVAGMVTLYLLIRKRWDEHIAELTIFLISIFPTTYFLSVAYPESLFIFLFSFSFYLAERKFYLLAAFVGGLAASTRPFGLVIFPSLILFLIEGKELNFKNFIFSGIIFTLPLVPYVWFNYSLFGSPFEFSTFLKQNWNKSFAFPWVGIIESWKRGIYTTELTTYKFFVGYAEAVASTLAWITSFFALKKWGVKSPYFIYLLLGSLFFTSTGFILSAPRYLLSIPPFFIILSKFLSKNKSLKLLWIVCSLVLFVWFSKEFALGKWAF